MKMVHSTVTFRIATTSWYREQVYEQVYYCICKLRTKRTFVAEGWIGSFTPNVWLGVLISILSLSIITACQSKNVSKTDIKFPAITRRNLFMSLFDVFGLFLRQGKLRKNPVMLLCTFIAALLLASYENFMTSSIIAAPEPPNHHTLNSLFEAGYTLLYELHSNLPNHLLPDSTKHTKLVNSSTFQLLRAMVINENQYLAYFETNSEVEGKFVLDYMQLGNKGCTCFIINLKEIPGYTEINHFLKSQFLRNLNLLQQNGLYHFYENMCTITAQKLELMKSERRLAAEEILRTSKIGSAPSIEFESTIYIGSSNLNVIFCLLGISFLSSILLFILVELKVLIISVRCAKQFFSKKTIRKFYYKVRLDVIALVRDLNR
jgi:hypothetical protein